MDDSIDYATIAERVVSALDTSPASGDQMNRGAYVAIFAEGPDADHVSMAARNRGLVLKDTILVGEASTTSFILLFKTPSARTAVEDAQVGVGVLNIDASRVGHYQNPMAFEGYERTSQVGNWGMRASKSRLGEPSAEQSHPNGRWPPNVVVIEGPLARQLDEVHGSGDTGSASKFYPRFASMRELKAWIEKLLTGPGCVETVPG